MTHQTTFGLHPGGLARLLTIGAQEASSGNQRTSDKAAARLLRDRLSGPLPLDAAMVDSPPAVLHRPCRELWPLADRALRDVLLDATTDLGILETLKDYAKALSQGWEEGPEHAVAVAVYYAAIAAALVFHNRKITARSYERLADSLAMLMDDRWMDPQLARLFAQAEEICRRET